MTQVHEQDEVTAREIPLFRLAAATAWEWRMREIGPIAGDLDDRQHLLFGIRFEDYPEMQDPEVPDLSHLSRDSATRCTRAYAGLPVGQYRWLDQRAAAGLGS